MRLTWEPVGSSKTQLCSGCWGPEETWKSDSSVGVSWRQRRVTSEFKQGKIQGVWSKVEAVRVGRSRRPMTLDKGSTVRGRRKDESQAPR